MERSVIINMLEQTIKQPSRLYETMSALQALFQEESTHDTPTDEVLRELAYDLDFYEPDYLSRKEDQRFLDEDKALDEIKEALLKLRRMR